MKNKAVLLVVPYMLMLAACTPAAVEQPGETTEPIQEIESSKPTDFDAWKEVKPGVFDISSLVQFSDSVFAADLFFDQQLILTLDSANRAYGLYSFDKDTLALTREEMSISGAMATEVAVKGDHIVFWEPPEHFNEHNVRLYDMVHGAEDSWTLNADTEVGYSGEKNDVLLISTTEEDTITQSIYEKDMDTGEETTILDWQITDGTKSPYLLALSQGEMGFAYVGTIYTTMDQQSDMCVGLVDRQGNLCELKKVTAYDVAYYNGGMVVYDTTPTIGQANQPLGCFQVYDANHLTVTEVTPKSAGETSRKLTVSENGKYIVTKEENCYRVYDVAQNELLKEFSFSMETEDLTQEMIYVSEQGRGVLLMSQGESSRQLYYIPF